MKHLLSFGLLCLLSITNISSDIAFNTYYPVFMKRADLEKSVQYKQGERAMEDPGKIYYKEPYIYVSERYKGVHIINNSNPANPVKEGFITAPGCIDIAVKDNIMYLDNAVDLVAFNLDTNKETSRIKNILPEPIPPTPNWNIYKREEGMIIVGWKINLIIEN